MPELPEVETVARGLFGSLCGREIEQVVLHRPDLRIPFPDGFESALEGARIINVSRRAKYLLIHLSNAQTVVIHLGMSGTIRVMPLAEYVERTHEHVWWELEGGERLIFRDPRRFGLMTLCASDALESHELFAHLGPEPLGDEFNETYLKTALKGRQTSIKVALMDQRIVVGVGNIYASEALFRSRISPFMAADKTAKQAKSLVTTIREVLQEAIASGGSTLRDYVRSSGDLGYFQHHFQVYGRDAEACVSCSELIQKSVQANRSTYFCIKCQNVKL